MSVQLDIRRGPRHPCSRALAEPPAGAVSRNTTTRSAGDGDHLVVAAAQRLLPPPPESVEPVASTVFDPHAGDRRSACPSRRPAPGPAAARSTAPAGDVPFDASHPSHGVLIRTRVTLRHSGDRPGPRPAPATAREDPRAPAPGSPPPAGAHRGRCAPHRATSSGPTIAGPNCSTANPSATAGRGQQPQRRASARRRIRCLFAIASRSTTCSHQVPRSTSRADSTSARIVRPRRSGRASNRSTSTPSVRSSSSPEFASAELHRLLHTILDAPCP